MEIRTANLSDLSAIYTIELENFSSEEAIAQEILARHIELFPSTFLVAEQDSQILGFLEGPVRPERHLQDSSFTLSVEDYSAQSGGYITITSLSVSKEAQKKGVGKQLLEVMKKIAIKDRRAGINLTCHDYLIPYYEKHGFINEGLSQSTYADEIWYDMVWEPYLESTKI